MQMSIFENLFVLELANNHWGSLERGLKIIDDFAIVVKRNNIKAAIKLQFRDVDNFIHESFKSNKDIRYIKKTLDTKMSKEDFAQMIQRIKFHNLIPMATPFDEISVDLCLEFDLPIIKIASSDISDHTLINKILSTKRPSIVSTGGATLNEIDTIVGIFNDSNIPLAINHCVSLYPSEDKDLELNQIDFLKARYPKNTIGFSTHEYHDWNSSIMIAYAKGARTFERHIDIDYQNIPVSPYCSLPEQADTWFKAFHKAVEMCGNTVAKRRTIKVSETEYLLKLLRGLYAKRDLPANYILKPENLLTDFYLAIPLQTGQISCKNFNSPLILKETIKANQPIMLSQINSITYIS